MSEMYHTLFETIYDELLEQGMDDAKAYALAGEMAYDALPEAMSNYYEQRAA